MASRTVTLRNGMFQASVLEVGHGTPLLYLHGTWPVELEGGAFLEALAARFRVVAPRHPGFGESTGAEHLLDLHDLLYYQLDLLDALGLDNLPLVGHGLGGMFAAELAAVQPRRFTRLALIAPLGLWNQAYPIPDFFTYGPEKLARALYADPESPPARRMAKPPSEGDEMIAYHLERAKALAATARFIWPIPNRGLNKRLHRVSMPTLLLWGQHDQIVPPAYAEDFKRLVPQAETVLVPDAGHQVEVDQPGRTAETLLSFLA